MKELDIGGRLIGPGQSCFVIAEAGVNHNGDMGLARELVAVAADAGADAVKFQTFKAGRLASATAPKANYQLQMTDAAESQEDMLRRLELLPESHHGLQAYCAERGLMFISTPFDQESADFLESLDVPAFKVASGDAVNLPLLRHIARKGKPVILSTGMSYLGEVETAVKCVRQEGNDKLVVLHCVSNYPAAAKDINLRAMQTIAQAFEVPVGYSDHTLGIEVPIAAVALGACLIEKHFTLDCAMSGPDHRASLEPDELKGMVQAIRNVEQAMGNGVKAPADSEENTRQIARRSIYLRCDVAAGSQIREEDLIALRPSGGLTPDLIDSVVGRQLSRSLPAGAQLSWGDLA